MEEVTNREQISHEGPFSCLPHTAPLKNYSWFVKRRRSKHKRSKQWKGISNKA
jgi:hypothetical protein